MGRPGSSEEQTAEDEGGFQSVAGRLTIRATSTTQDFGRGPPGSAVPGFDF
jgi:hypothetical protein